MRVYILHYQKWEDQYIVGVFTTQELAEKYLKDLEEKATARYHSTTIQAATIAKLAEVNHLMIGHFQRERLKKAKAQFKPLFVKYMKKLE